MGRHLSRGEQKLGRTLRKTPSGLISCISCAVLEKRVRNGSMAQIVVRKNDLVGGCGGEGYWVLAEMKREGTVVILAR